MVTNAPPNCVVADPEFVDRAWFARIEAGAAAGGCLDGRTAAEVARQTPQNCGTASSTASIARLLPGNWRWATQFGGRAPDALEAAIQPSGAIPTRGGGHGPKSKNLGNQKTDIIRQRARGSAAPSCPPHLPVPRVLASSRRCFSLSAFHPPAPGFSLSAFCLIPRCRNRVRLRREACCRAF